jgi:HD superfamily phosphohydrolase
MKEFKSQRIRDPLHNMIEFGANEFEDVLWRVIQTRPFQRLRRIRQLGFSEFVYPGATHSRFAHSIGVFNTARQLMGIIERHLHRNNHYLESKAHRALAAALVHDLGHGPFSHAFEDVGRRFGMSAAKHEVLSDRLIRGGEVAEVLNEMGQGFADDVADVVKSKTPRHIYDAVVSSQFDADRLDYMRRDRMMTGMEHGAIDFQWLVSNLEIGTVTTGVDDTLVGTTETLILGPKAVFAAEAYVLGLFQLYPTVYFHKTTRGIEKLFTELLARMVMLAKDGSYKLIGLPRKHPLVKFANDPENLDTVLDLDDTIVWGAIPLLQSAKDKFVSSLSRGIRDRGIYECCDIRSKLDAWLRTTSKETVDQRAERLSKIEKACERLEVRIRAWNAKQTDGPPRILIDREERAPYKQLQESKGPLNQILIRTAKDGPLVDLGLRSEAVAAIETYRLYRLYFSRGDDESRKFVEKLVKQEKDHASS